MSKYSLAGLLVVAVASAAHAGAIVTLLPDQPGPYSGGEQLQVDVWLQSDVLQNLVLRGMWFDFAPSDANLTLDAAFGFDFSTVPDPSAFWTIPELPMPSTWMSLDCLCPELMFPFDSGTSLHIGHIDLQLPEGLGTYTLDLLNRDEPGPELGAEIRPYNLAGSPVGVWRANTGEISGGAFDFVVVPEPGALTFAAFGALAVLAMRYGPRLGRDHRRRHAH